MEDKIKFYGHEEHLGFADIQVIIDIKRQKEYVVLCNAVGGMVLLSTQDINNIKTN